MATPRLARSARLRDGSTRIYETADGTIYPSVTSVIDQLDKPALIYWAARMSAEYATLHREALADLPADDAITLIKGNWRKARDKAGARGTRIHEYLEDPTWTPTLEAAPYLEQAQIFLEANNLTVAATEISFSHPGEGYAGTADVIATSNGDRYVVDWKTGKGIYDSHALQIVALGEATHQLDEYGGEHPSTPIDYGVVVRLAPDEHEAHLIQKGSEQWVTAWDAFRGLIPVWQWKREVKEIWNE